MVLETAVEVKTAKKSVHGHYWKVADALGLREISKNTFLVLRKIKLENYSVRGYH